MKAAAVAACLAEAEACGEALVVMKSIADHVAQQVDEAPEEARKWLQALGVARRCTAQSAENWRDIARSLDAPLEVPNAV